MIESFLVGGSGELVALVGALAQAARPMFRPEEELGVRVMGHLALAGRRGASQRETARALDVAEATVSRLCDQLEVDGLIRREAHPNDRRVKMLHLAPAGAEHLQLCAHRTCAGLDLALSDFTPGERVLLARLLDRLKAAPRGRRACEGCRVGGC
ncbi:MAG: MarR family transcriptional regulator [Alphaproteobacteria bacterium]|nr:MarR family transcriptional regulator [Alphaproteobacteria bacterium]MBU1525217.1 MarR family transcriptional regulator [Alphaproteobacteria bacterium]MBU2352213.1 MarR family transcriptional regulator [Alphaproteobacteria bacterium]